MDSHGFANGQAATRLQTRSVHATSPMNASPPTAEHSNTPFEHNRNMIPGLGLGYSAGSAWTQPWTGVSPSVAPVIQQVPQATEARPALPSSTQTYMEGVEEPELSEGELPDIYELYEPASSAPSKNKIASNTLPNGKSGFQTPTEIAGEPTPPDRSGSYSPFLSSKEVITPSDDEMQESLDEASNGLGEASIDPANSLTSARKTAKDAILRLWPLNVRFQTYVDEGIDRAHLESLFLDLGLDINASPAVRTSDGRPSVTPLLASPKRNAQQASMAVKPAPEVGDPQGEARKDRIARLLAAKNTKPSTVIEAGNNDTTVSATVTDPPKVPQSDIAKRLHKKMEELQKSREALAQQSIQQNVSSSGLNTPQARETEEPVETATTSIIRHEAPTRIELPKSHLQPAPSGHGVSVSSTPLAQTPGSHKRPVAADFNEVSEISTKRPFGQTRPAQPFLIDVSDDDDDTAMDIDSPDLKPASLNKPSSPFRIPSFRDMPTVPSLDRGQQLSVTNPSTPAGTPNGNSGKYDLANMDKQIEEMKRRIAEAEARKKTRQSRPASPSTDQPPQQAQETIPISAASTPKPDIPTFQIRDSASPPHSSTEMESQKLPKLSEMRLPNRLPARRSLSRAASERLPMIESHRKMQLMKLQALQSQINRIQKEIEQGMAEETKLREEEPEPTSDEEEAPEEVVPLIEQPSVPPEQVPFNEDQGSFAMESSPQSDPASPERDHVLEPPVTFSFEGSANAKHDQIENSQILEADGLTQVGVADTNTLPDLDIQVGPPVVEDSLASPGEEPTHATGAASPNEVNSSESSEDGYEPPEAASKATSQVSSHFSPAPAASVDHMETSDSEAQLVAAASPVSQRISGGEKGMSPVSSGEDDQAQGEPVDDGPKSSFIPYETPLQYFRAYRFHPEYTTAVPGGLRSLTYSNKIDPKKDFCPEQLAGDACPRGTQCGFQHFESMQAPDDQILVQLGGYGNYEGDQRLQYNEGLRQVLTGFRARKIKDFQTISQGIIEYRAKFRGDSSKILPLGDVNV